MRRRHIQKTLWAIFGLFGVCVLLFAESPERLDFGHSEKPKPRVPIRVQVPAEKPPERPEPENSPPAPSDALAALAPPAFESQANFMDSGSGLAFGRTGGGPGIRGGGGLGGNVDGLVSGQSKTDRPARVISRPSLDYPLEAKRRGIRGAVLIRVHVGPSGQVQEARIAESDPPGFFDEAVLSSVRLWRFEPAIVRGHVASGWVTQRIRFEVE